MQNQNTHGHPESQGPLREANGFYFSHSFIYFQSVSVSAYPTLTGCHCGVTPVKDGRVSLDRRYLPVAFFSVSEWQMWIWGSWCVGTPTNVLCHPWPELSLNFLRSQVRCFFRSAAVYGIFYYGFVSRTSRFLPRHRVGYFSVSFIYIIFWEI